MASLRLIAALTAALLPSLASADGWLVAEAPAAIAVSDAQAGVFRPGAMPAVGAYADNGWFALGARLRAGVLRNGPSPTGGLQDPGYGGLATGSLAMRVHKRGIWVEGAAGGGVTGGDVVPAIEAGVGFAFGVGDFDVGPSGRFVRVIANSDMDAYGSADLLLVGLDVSWGKNHAKKLGRATVAAAPMSREMVVPQVYAVIGPVEPDGDRIGVDTREQSCAQKMDGCPITEHVTMYEDRIVLDEAVLFDFDRARVRTAGKKLVAEVASMWRAHPEWQRITVEGHTDVRGSDIYNQALSERRAQLTRDVLVSLGFDSTLVDAVGFGRSKPRVEASDEQGHHKNRRVEFRIERAMEVAK